MKRLKFSWFLIAIILFINITNVITVKAEEKAPALSTEGVVVLNSNTGEVVYAKNPDQRYFPASTTKVLTALIVIEHCNLAENVTIGKNPPFADGTSIGLKEGEVFTVKELLLGLILESGNDCAEALAEHVAGTSEEFAKLMNIKAKELGATNSNFKNPSGLPDEEHYTTPRDLALIMNGAIKNETFHEICQTKILQLQPSTVTGEQRWINNKNAILLENSNYYYPYAECSKKGYTIAAKFTNVISCTKDGDTYVGSFLRGENIDSVYSDVRTVFDYVFNNFKNVKLYSADETVGEIKIDDDTILPLKVTKDIYYTVARDKESSITNSIEIKQPTNIETKSFKTGDIVTTGTIKVNNSNYVTIDLASTIDRKYIPPKTEITNYLDDHKISISVSILIAIVILLILRILYIRRKRARIRKLKYYKMKQKMRQQRKKRTS